MLFLKFFLGLAPFQLRVRGPGEDEAVEDDAWVVQPALDFFDALMKQDLFATWSLAMQKAMGVKERHVLLVSGQEPKDEVRVKITSFEEAHAFAMAHVSEEKDFNAIVFKGFPACFAPALEIRDELIFAFVEHYRQDGDLATLADMKEWLKEVLPEITGIKIAGLEKIIFPEFQVLLYLPYTLNDLSLIAIDDKLIQILLRQIVIIRRQLPEFQAGFNVFPLTVVVILLTVTLQEFRGYLLEEHNAPEI
jgi:hypothetical protein